MKYNKAYIIGIVVLMAVVLLFMMTAPTRFNWDDTSQSCYSKEPFGCYVMDSVLKASLPQGYEVVGQAIDDIFNQAHKGKKYTFLFTFDSYIDGDLLKLVKKGNNVILALDSYYAYEDEVDIEKFLGFTYISSYYSNFDGNDLRKSTQHDDVEWQSSSLFPPATFKIHETFVWKTLNLSDSFRTLAVTVMTSYDDNGYTPRVSRPAVAGIRQYGAGKVVVTSMPMIFTNYGILNDTIRPLVFRLLSECGDLPVVRYDWNHIDEKGNEEGSSPLHYLIANRPLRWAFYLALATVVAFVLFSARRRQRVIPVIKPPVNHMMDFVKRIGGIYYQRHDNVDLLIKKYVTFGNELRAKAMIDINNYDHIDEELQSLSRRTGIPFEELRAQIFDVWKATNAKTISDERLKQLIDMMNNILKKNNI